MIFQVRHERLSSRTRLLLNAIRDILDSYTTAVSVRQIFYRLVAAELIKNTKQCYAMVSRIVTAGRYNGILDWDAIEDGTRGAYKPISFNSIEEAVQDSIRDFRYDRWKDNEYYLEVWVEKRTMTQLFYSVTAPFDVRLVVGGGFNSASAVWNAVRRLNVQEDLGKKVTLLYFGDYDPSGDFMHEDIEKRLKEFGLNPDVVRILLTESQVKKHKLPVAFQVMATKATGEVYNKLEADPRAKGFQEKHGKLFQVEVEALAPELLVDYIKVAIGAYIEPDELNRILDKEESERKRITNLLKRKRRKK